MAKDKGPKRSLLVHLENILNVFIEFGKIQPTIRAVIYWVIIIVGSWIHDFHRPPESYFSNKRNIFNVIFVKFALAWTLAVLVPFVVLSSLIKSQSNVTVVLKNVSRLLVAIIIWFIVTSTFDWILDFTGFCEGSEMFSSKRSCVAEGLIWRGFDISGHSFLLAYCSLMIIEEVQVVSFWSDKKFSLPRKSHFTFAMKPLANILYICCCLLMLLWELMLVFTAVYFHTVETKILGVIIAILSWAVTYKYYFETGYFSLGLPKEF